ncbi:MAG: lactate utilization protein [Bacillota bacterium]
MTGDLIEKAVRTLKEREMQVYPADNGAGALEIINGIINSGPVALSPNGLVNRLGLYEALRARDIEVYYAGRDTAASPGESLARNLERAACGITGAGAIAADTGSIFIIEDRGNDHLVSALPPVHIVVAGAGAVVPTLTDAVKMCRNISRETLNKPLARYISVISGPSMTADIQGVLVKGMHGPLEVHVVLVYETLNPGKNPASGTESRLDFGV